MQKRFFVFFFRFVVSKYMQISANLIRYSLISIFKHKITENLQ